MTDPAAALWDLLFRIQVAMRKHPTVVPPAVWVISLSDLDAQVTIDGKRVLASIGAPERFDCEVRVPFEEIDRLLASPMRAVWLGLTGTLTWSDRDGALVLGQALMELDRRERQDV